MPRFTVFIAALFVLSACSSVERFSNDSPQMVAEPDKVSAMLADAADRASNALQSLAAVEHARGPGVAVGPIGDAPIELRRAVTVNWIGPVSPITKSLADRAGYRFNILGTSPPVPLVVTLDVENKPLIEALRDIGLQLGNRADIRVDANKKLVELHYPPNTGIMR